MELVTNLLNGLSILVGFQPILIITIGVIAGILGGAIPGISPSMAVALFLPFTFNMSPTMALVLLVAIYTAANFGGSITAVTINRMSPNRIYRFRTVGCAFIFPTVPGTRLRYRSYGRGSSNQAINCDA